MPNSVQDQQMRILRPIAGFLAVIVGVFVVAFGAFSTVADVASIPQNIATIKDAGRAALVWLAHLPASAIWVIGPVIIVVGFAILLWHPEHGFRWASAVKIEPPKVSDPIEDLWNDPDRDKKLTVVDGRYFSKITVPLDGHFYTNCTFEKASFVYNGGYFKLTHNTFSDLAMRTENPQIGAFIHVCAVLGIFPGILTEEGPKRFADFVREHKGHMIHPSPEVEPENQSPPGTEAERRP